MSYLASVRGRVLGAAVGAVVVACGLLVGGVSVAAVAAGTEASVRMLSVQRVDGLHLNGASSACLFVNDVRQAPGASFYHRHQPGAVYVAGGEVDLTIWQDGLGATDPGATSQTSVLAAGDGAIIPTLWWHRHANRSLSANEWYFLSQLPSSERACVNPPSSFLFRSASVQLADGPSLLKLFTTTFGPGDSTAQAGPGFAESVVLSGSVLVDGVAYSQGHGFLRTPGMVLQMSSAVGAELVTYSIHPLRR